MVISACHQKVLLQGSAVHAEQEDWPDLTMLPNEIAGAAVLDGFVMGLRCTRVCHG